MKVAEAMLFVAEAMVVLLLKPRWYVAEVMVVVVEDMLVVAGQSGGYLSHDCSCLSNVEGC